MFKNISIEINGAEVTGLPAVAMIATPFIACVFLGIMIGLAL